MNKSIVVGNVGQTPTLRYLDDGTPVTTLSVGENDRSGSRENRSENTVWYKADFFGNSAEIITKHVNKGDLIYVEGRLKKPEPWIGDDGKARVNLVLKRCDFQFLPRGKRTNEDAGEAVGAQTTTEPSDLSDDDIPY